MKKPIYLSPSAKLWLYMCCFMNVYSIVSYAVQGYYYSSVTLGVVVVGYLMLLFLHNRWGYVIAVGISLLTVVLTLSTLGITALLALFQPMLTWMFIKRDWKGESEVAAEGQPLIKGIRELTLAEHNEAQAPETSEDKQPEPEMDYIEPPAREDLTKTMADISASIEMLACIHSAEEARKQARDYLITKGRMARVKIVQYMKSRLNADESDFDSGALLDVIDALKLPDNADVLIDMLTVEPFFSNDALCGFLADRLIACKRNDIYEKLCARAVAKNEAVNRVLDSYRPETTGQ